MKLPPADRGWTRREKIEDFVGVSNIDRQARNLARMVLLFLIGIHR
jgi:hypothetical protein